MSCLFSVLETSCCHLFSKNGKVVHVIDPSYKEMMEAKIVDVFGERKLESVYKMIEDILEDEKMVSVTLM